MPPTHNQLQGRQCVSYTGWGEDIEFTSAPAIKIKKRTALRRILTISSSRAWAKFCVTFIETRPSTGSATPPAQIESCNCYGSHKEANCQPDEQNNVNALARAERIHSTNWVFAASSNLHNLNNWSIPVKDSEEDSLYQTVSPKEGDKASLRNTVIF